MRAAAIDRLIETAKLNGMDSEAYLRQMIERIGDQPINRVGDVLPWRVAEGLKPDLPQAA